jgi:nitrogen regulatory protein PII
MKLLIFILNKEEFLEVVMEAYVEAGVPGATILDSEGMGRFLAYEIPLFSDFKDFMKGNKPYNKTIISVIPDDLDISRLLHRIEEFTGPLDDPGTGIMFTLPVDWAAGLRKTEE